MNAPVESNKSSAVSGALLAELVEEITQAIEAGTPVDLDAYLLAFPQHAEELRRLLPAVQALGQMGGPECDAVSREGQAGTEGHEVSGVLGDFRIVRELGRGGMGVVYEAEQISLGRRVALKVLPLAAMLDPRHLQRFQNEARAAASLRHEHIVPVYAVGNERGVHYYAMQLIDGPSLAEVIAGQRGGSPTARSADPTADYRPPAPDPAADTAPVAKARTECAPRDAAYFRRVAEWGIQAAEALEHAHTLGIVHRDVKPANLMLDGAGKLWVTDFGLARLGADSGLTMTGDLVGTLRYMSPEQALARHGLVDHRTDVYALGATLYEVLTGRPAVDGKDREEILRRIAFDEPARLRQLERSIPLDLETVVLKALAKEPTERYASAKELVADLRRYLEDKPILARRPSLLQRVNKWTRRHMRLVVGGAFLLFVTGLVLIISSAMIWQVNQEATHYHHVAELRRADITGGEAKRNETREHLEGKLTAALLTLEEVLAEVHPPDGGRALQNRPLQRAVAEHALHFYERALKDKRITSGRYWEELGWAFLRLANSYAHLGEFDRAAKVYGLIGGLHGAFRRAELYGQLVSPTPIRNRPQAEKSYRQALAAWREKSPDTYNRIEDYRECLTAWQLRAAEVLTRQGKASQAEQAYQEQVALLERVSNDFPGKEPTCVRLLESLLAQGDRCGKDGRSQAAQEVYKRALKHYERLVKELRLRSWRLDYYTRHVVGVDGKPVTLQFGFHNSSCETAFGLAKRLKEIGCPQDADRVYRLTAALLDRMAGQTLDRSAAKNQLVNQFANVCDGVGHRLVEVGMLQESGQVFALELAAREHLLACYDRVPNSLQRAQALNNLAWSLATCTDPQIRNAHRAVKLATQATALLPKDGNVWNTLAVAHYRTGNWEACLEALGKAASLRGGDDIRDLFFLAMANWQLGKKEQARERYEKGANWMAKNRILDEELRRLRTEAAQLLGVERKKD